MVGERIEELVGEIPEQQTIFWVTPRHYAAFDAELRALYERPYHVDEQLRLFDLGDGALRTFLKDDLPRSAALSDYEREILCLPPRP